MTPLPDVAKPSNITGMKNGKTQHPGIGPRRSQRVKDMQKKQSATQACIHKHHDLAQLIPDSHLAYNAAMSDVEVIMGAESVTGMDPDLFQPAPQT